MSIHQLTWKLKNSFKTSILGFGISAKSPKMFVQIYPVTKFLGPNVHLEHGKSSCLWISNSLFYRHASDGQVYLIIQNM